jgi:hypothetical protein
LEQTVSLDEKRLVSVLKERIADLPGLLGRNIPETRQILRKMIEGKILCEPVPEHGSSAYRFSATGTYGAVLCPPPSTNDCGEEQGFFQSLVPFLQFRIEGIATAA